MLTEEHSNDSVISYTRDNQKEQSQENKEDETIFPKRTSLKDLLSIELCDDGHYPDRLWLSFCWFFVQSSFQTTKLIKVEIWGDILINV